MKKMKKITFIMALLAISFMSCRNDIDIIRKLADNEAATIPFSVGNSVAYVDHNSDTVKLVVETDEQLKLCASVPFLFYDDSKMTKPYSPDCYGRVVRFYDQVYDNATLTLIALPDSLLGVKMTRHVVGAEPENMYVEKVIDLKKNLADSITVEGTTYYNVYIAHDPRIIYSCTDGMLLLKADDCLYTKIQ